MTDVHVTCLACIVNPPKKISSVTWILSLTMSFEKWRESFCDPARYLHLYLLSYQTRSNYCVLGGWNSQCIIFRRDLQYRQTYFLREDILWIQGFVSEITVFAVMALFSHSCMSWILISSLTRYLLCQGLAVGSPCWFLTSRKSESENLSLSPDLHAAAAHVRSGEAACLIIGLIPQCSGCVTECCDSRPRLFSLKHWAFLNLIQLTSNFYWSVWL